MTRLEALFAERTAERRRLACERAALVLERLRGLGVEARIAGSLARGTFKLHSDVDFLILDCPDELRYRIETRIEELMESLPFDCIYLDEVGPPYQEKLLAEARDAPASG